MHTDASADSSASRRSWRRWTAVVVFGALFVVVMWTVVNPYRGQDYGEIPHGDHVHYIPKDRNAEVPVSRFPTRPPEPGERITPEGEVVPDPSAASEENR
jgi:hypothetical protein